MPFYLKFGCLIDEIFLFLQSVVNLRKNKVYFMQVAVLQVVFFCLRTVDRVWIKITVYLGLG